MNRLEGKIVHLLTGKERLEDVSVEELQKVAASQPYFSVAQLLLTKKMQQLDHPGYRQQLEKTALYFPNAHWLRYQLMDDHEVVGPLTLEKPEAPSDPEEQLKVPAATGEPENQGGPLTVDTGSGDAGELPAGSRHTSDNNPEDADNEPVAENTGNLRLAELLQHQAEQFNKPLDDNAQLPLIKEPYHTIDYFASQGIRLTALQQQDDKLGKQVKKFTDWLKQMKKIGPAQVETDPEMEHKVQDIAETSNEAKEVVTEAMAEVLVKQGRLEKAIQLYIKLSFLNPDKSAYFAARIEELKGL